MEADTAAVLKTNSGNPKVFVSIAEAAEITSLSKNTIYRLIAGNVLGSYKIGKKRLIKVSELVKLIEDRSERRTVSESISES